MPIFLRRQLIAVALAVAMAGGPALAQQYDGDPGAYLASRVASADSDYLAAAGWYGKALIADPTNPALLEGAIIAHMALGNFELASGLAQKLIDTGSKSQTAYIARVADKAKTGDFAGILADQAAGQKVGPLIDGLVAAWAELGNGQMSQALKGFDALAKEPGMEAFGLYHKALALASVGDFEGADEILSGRASGPITVMRRGVLAHVQILSQLERNPDAVALLDRTFGKTEPDREIDDLRARLTAGEPLAYDVSRNATDGLAEVFFTIATALNGEADDGYTLLYSRVAAHLRPDHTEAILLTAGLLELKEQYGLATEAYALIPPENPAFHVAEIGRANALLQQDKREAAVEVMQALARSHPQIIPVHIALGDVLRQGKDFKESLVAYDAAVALITTPTQRHWALYYARGISHEQLGDWVKSEADMRKALTLNPDQPQVLNYLGYSFVDRGENLEEALGMIERAVKAQPDAGYIIDSLAWAYYRLGRYQDALEPMERASLLEPVDPVVTDHLGDVYWAVGRTREAQFQWSRALSFGPTEKDAPRIRRKLEVGLDVVLQEEGAKPLKPVDAADAGN